MKRSHRSQQGPVQGDCPGLSVGDSPRARLGPSCLNPSLKVSFCPLGRFSRGSWRSEATITFALKTPIWDGARPRFPPVDCSGGCGKAAGSSSPHTPDGPRPPHRVSGPAAQVTSWNTLRRRGEPRPWATFQPGRVLVGTAPRCPLFAAAGDREARRGSRWEADVAGGTWGRRGCGTYDGSTPFAAA